MDDNIITPDISLYKFSFLRQNIWIPRFKWIKTISESADIINSWHEDYPERVKFTENVIDIVSTFFSNNISNINLKAAHKIIFSDAPFRGQFRKVNVRVGTHRAPEWETVEEYMNELEKFYKNKLDNLDYLLAWGVDGLTIHPFQDGNGRVFNSFISALSNNLFPELGYLTALQ